MCGIGGIRQAREARSLPSLLTGHPRGLAMGFCIGKRGAPPWPPIRAPIHKEEKDRFGLPVVWSLLGESDEERKARISAAKRLIKDAFERFETAARHLGHDEARCLFAELSKNSPKGKQADQDINRHLLDRYDRAVSEAPEQIKSIPRLLARRLNSRNPGSVEATEKQIRRLVKKRDERAKAEAAQLEKIFGKPDRPCFLADP
jgi:hypothetical protein